MFLQNQNLISPKTLGKTAWLAVQTIGKTLSIEERYAGTACRRDSGCPLIYVAWHGRMLIPMFWIKNTDVTILVSEHRDGEIVTATLESAGYETVRGSTTRGGVRALAKLIRLAKRGVRIGFTVDGPRGPRERVQPGAVFVAAKTGLPLVPIVGSAKHAHYLKSWDAFQIPFPFSRAVLSIGEPYYVTGGSDPENIEFHRTEIEQRLTELTLEADEIVGASTGK